MWHLKIVLNYFMHFDLWNYSWGTTDEKKYYNKKIQGAYFVIKYLLAIQTLVGSLCNWKRDFGVYICKSLCWCLPKVIKPKESLCHSCKLFSRQI